VERGAWPGRAWPRGAALADPTLYLFDGYNVLHAGAFEDTRELVDRLADFVAVRGARGVVVFDGVGADTQLGRLAVRYAADADALLERLAAEHRDREEVCLVSSDAAVRGTSGQEVRKLTSHVFLRDLEHVRHHEPEAFRLGERVDDETRARLERLRRGQD
jgi:predicted RNA-binding protein with PIN domain